MALNVNGIGMTGINVNGVAMTDVVVNGVVVFGGVPESIIVHTNRVHTNSEWVTGVMEKQFVESSTILGEHTKTVDTPFTLTSKAKQTYNTCTVTVGYGTGGDYGSAEVRYNNNRINVGDGYGTKTYVIGTSDIFGSLTVWARGTVDYTAKWAEVWIESITLSGKK